MISVILTQYKHENYLPEAVISIVNQTYQDWELIFVDDGSLDGSARIALSYCQKQPAKK